jgi:RNA polymerase sigma-70 factor (ECF subfamily)
MAEARVPSFAGHAAGSFVTTRWSVICAAGGADSVASRQAWDELFRIYWYPLYCYVRRCGRCHADAEDLVQALFVHLFERDFIQQADPARGRLRGFLCRKVRNFLADERKHEHAAKRGGGVELLPLDFTGADERFAAESAAADSPERSLDQAWARELLREAWRRVAQQWSAKGQSELLEALRPFLLAPLDVASATRIAADAGWTKESVMVRRSGLLREYGAALRALVADTVASPAEIDEEIRYLRAVVEASGNLSEE